jgi:hypothetical protein
MNLARVTCPSGDGAFSIFHLRLGFALVASHAIRAAAYMASNDAASDASVVTIVGLRLTNRDHDV